MTLISAMSLLIQICLLNLAVFFVFAILGVTLFVGKMESCNDFSLVNGENSILDRDMCVGNTVFTDNGDSVLVPRVWKSYDQTFDNVGYALSTLFEVTSMDSWSVVMFNAINSGQVYQQPFPGQSPIYSLYFVAFVFLSSMFVLQMFVAVVVDRFVSL